MSSSETSGTTDDNNSSNNGDNNPVDNIMENSLGDTATNDEEELPVVRRIDDSGTFGYQCARVVENNVVTEIPVVFFVDLAFPRDTLDLAVTYVQEQLIEAVALEYGVSTGRRCDDPKLDGSTWLVQILGRTDDWKQETIFDSCRELAYDETTHDCFVFQAAVRGSVLDGDMEDVLEFMEKKLSGPELTKTSPYSVGFLGVPVMSEEMGDSGRDNLDEASNVNQLNESIQTDDSLGRETITIVGGLLVAALSAAVMGIVLVVWRRRREWISRHDHHQHMDGGYPQEFTLDKPPHCLARNSAHDDDRDDIRHYNTHPHLTNEEDDDEHDALDDDMGHSFNHQIMGIHRAPSKSSGGGSQRTQPLSSTGSSIGFEMPYHPYRAFGGGSDAASETSDADSWAQTDGTIGSLELQLEPITAEV